MGLSEFRTNYGVPPDGAELSEKSLMNLFGEEAQGYLDEDQISEQRKLTKAGEHDEAAKVKEQLMNELYDKLVLPKNVDEGGAIKIRATDKN